MTEQTPEYRVGTTKAWRCRRCGRTLAYVGADGTVEFLYATVRRVGRPVTERCPWCGTVNAYHLLRAPP